MYEEKIKPDRLTNLGTQGEHLARRIVFNIEEWNCIFPNNTIELWYSVANRRPYRVSNIEYSDDNNILYWNITEEDTKYYGFGDVQLYCITSDSIAKSSLYKTYMNKAL